MSFSFSFFQSPDDIPNDTPHDTTAGVANDDNGEDKHSHTSLRVKRHILPGLDEKELIKSRPFAVLNLPAGITFKRSVNHFHSDLDEHADIVKGVYEGGYKIWECSIDLAEYFIQQRDEIGLAQSARVLELGCGHGLPGMAALFLGYRDVTFTDLNEEVIKAVTVPNLLLNFEDDTLVSKVQLYSGDWLALSDLWHSQSRVDCASSPFYDLILSSETIYSNESCKKLVHMLHRHLAPSGVALISTKRFYFGVGGGTLQLQELIDREHKAGTPSASGRNKLVCRIIRTYEDGKSNIREIIAVEYESS